MNQGRVGVGLAAFFGLLSAFGPHGASADVIDFEQYAGPSTFVEAGHAQTLNISTSVGIVKVSGGVILTKATSLPADESSIYGTAGNASNIGVATGSGYTNPIVITFPLPVSSFSLDILNGNTQPVTYQLADNHHNSASFNIAPNLSGGVKTFGFSSAGNVVTITAMTGQSTPNGITWDFFVDNINFTPLISVPEPSILTLGVAAGASGLIVVALRKNSNARSSDQ
jgi:hypothetical protein